MWHSRMEEKGRLNDSEPLLSQIILRCFKGLEETVGTVEHNNNAEMGVQTGDEMYQEQMCMDDSNVTEENSLDKTIPREELSDQYLLINRQEGQIGRNSLSDISNHSIKEGKDYTWDAYVLFSPKEGVLVNNISNEVLSSCHPKTRETELPDISGMNPKHCENVNKKTSNQTQSKVIDNYADTHQHGGNEVQLCTTEVEVKMGEDFCLLCPEQNDRKTERSAPYMKNLCCSDIGGHNSQEEFCQRTDSHANNSDDYYEYIEEFLGEGALVNIDSAQTYVDLESGTIKTSVEVSAEDEGVAVKHEVEWVTRFVQSQKLK